MTEPDASDRIDAEKVEDLESLVRGAADLTRRAREAAQAYERTAWIKYAAIFIPIPFVVLLLRLHLEAWGYYVAGGLFIAVALVMYAWDLAALARRDEAIRAAERAQSACESARRSRQST